MGRKRIDKDEVLNQIKASVFAYGLKAMASDLDKPYSTLSNELREAEYAKLGFNTGLSIIEHAHAPYAPAHSRDAAVMALDMVEEALGRVAFRIPDPPSDRQAPEIMRIISDLGKEFSEAIQAMAKAIEDGRVSRQEAKKCLKENRDLLKACLQIDHYLQRLEREK